MWREFKAFLIKENVLSLALAVVIGAALARVVTALVSDVIMPIVAFATPSGDWRATLWAVGPVKFGVGDLAGAIIDFVIIGFIVWRISKAFIKPRPAVAGPATKPCPFCKMAIDATATRCSFRTSQLSDGVAA